MVNDGAVTRLHAQLEPHEDGLWVRDLGSRNGTFVEGVRVTAARLPANGRLRVGSTIITFDFAKESERVDLWPSDTFAELVGSSESMRELFAMLERIATTDQTVLVQGETGTGKELVAHAVHEASNRRGGPFVIVDCGALPASLLESELFGHAKGAFTGAAFARAGAFEEADGGTLFLDEIGELPLEMQPKMLRALEARAVRRLGESGYRNVDVRFIAATHRDLAQQVNERGFREDLFFRLAVLPVHVPPLRERLEDIPLLAQRLAPEAAKSLSPQSMEALMSRRWPGNVRELKNTLTRVEALGEKGLASFPSPAQTTRDPFVFPALADQPFHVVKDAWNNRLERQYVHELLERHGRNVSAAAQAAGLNRTYLHRLIRKHGL